MESDELRDLLDKARLNGVLRAAPDEPGQRLLWSAVTALEKMERDNPGILAKGPRLALLIAEIARPCRRVVVREERERARRR